MKKKLILGLAEILLAFLCLVGDYYVFDNDILVRKTSAFIGQSERLVRALFDNSIHGIIGCTSWLVVVYPNLNKDLAVSAFISSIIDIDHFISARSFRVQDAVSLSQRPFLHNSLLMIAINFGLWFVDKKVSVLFFISWFSHHIRDANRRGIWFGPIYSTPPLNDGLYHSIILVTPLLVRYIYHSSYLQNDQNYIKFLKNYSNNNTNLEQIQLV